MHRLFSCVTRDCIVPAWNLGVIFFPALAHRHTRVVGHWEVSWMSILCDKKERTAEYRSRLNRRIYQ